jgi:hypothetical protein
VTCSLVEHWLFSWFHQPGSVSTPAFVREGRGPRGWAGWARCWALRERMFFVPPLLDRHLAERPRARTVHAGLPAWCVHRGTRRSRCRDRPYFENCIVDASIICSCQVTKGTRWMPWHQEPMKDVGACDKPRGVGNQTSIRGFPNGETCRA